MKSIYLLIGFVSLFFMSCVRDGEELDSTATEGSMDSSEMLVTTRSGGSDLLLRTSINGNDFIMTSLVASPYSNIYAKSSVESFITHGYIYGDQAPETVPLYQFESQQFSPNYGFVNYYWYSLDENDSDMPQNLNFTKSVIGYVHPGYSY